MKVKEAFRWTKEFYPDFNMEYAVGLSKKFELNPNMKITSLSNGYNTIFKLILALSCGAPVILFDEPALGLDANHRELFYKELIAHYGEHPKTVVISTHLIDEVSSLLEDVIIIKEGEIILEQPIEEVLQMAYTISGDGENVDKYAMDKNIIREENMGKYKSVTIYQKRDSADKEAISRLGLEIAPARLQELFISLTNS